MEFQLDHDWQLRPLKGDTGKAYVGWRAEDKVFIKRNTTPMLAALSKEGITPKLVWTKRTGNGDTLTAQEWLEGQILPPEELGQRNDVMDVLYQLHHSQSLKRMLSRIGGKVATPTDLLKEYQKQLPQALSEHRFLRMVLKYLQQNLPEFKESQKAVVHGDVNYRNWLICRNYLYLVDWDSIMFADPALDIGTFLGHYLPVSTWSHWLMSYGITPSVENINKVYWYALISILQETKKYYLREDLEAANAEITQLKRVFRG